MLAGRIVGTVAGDQYVIAQGDVILRSIPLHEAMADQKLAGTIKANGWQELKE